MKASSAAHPALTPLPWPPEVDYLWKQTNQVVPRWPVASISGRFGQSLVFVRRGHKTFVRPYVVPADPRSGYQIDWRRRFRQAQRFYSTLPESVRLEWGTYAVRHLYPSRAGESLNRLGQNAYTAAQAIRLSWGGTPLLSGPSALPPVAILTVSEVPAPVDGQIAFQLSHNLASYAGLRVVFELTPAMPTLKRRPRVGELTRAAVRDDESVFPLESDGATYLLERPRHTIQPGQRYGIRVRLVTQDGVAGANVFSHLTRVAFDPTAASSTLDQQVRADQVPLTQGPRTTSGVRTTGRSVAKKRTGRFCWKVSPVASRLMYCALLL